MARRSYTRDARGRFASTPGGGARKAVKLPAPARRTVGSKPQKRRGLLIQRSAAAASKRKLKGLDPADQSLSGSLKLRAQKGAVTRTANELKVAEQGGRRRIRTGAQPGIVRPGRQGRAMPAAATPASRPAVRGRQRLRMYGTGKDGVVLKKAFDAIKDNPFGKKNQTKNRNLQIALDWLKARGYQDAVLMKKSAVNGMQTTAAVILKGGYYKNMDGKYVVNTSDKPILALNALSNYWRNPGMARREARVSGWSSTASPMGTLLHEIGHMRDKGLEQNARVYGSNPYMLPVKDPQRPPGPPGTWRRVSEYGSRTQAEFVAETYAGLRTGQRYDRQVMKLYRQLMGSGDPALKARRSRKPRNP
jgi:hypothetical protein